MTTNEILKNLPPDYADKASARAGKLYADDKLNCAEAVFKALLEEAGVPCPTELCKLASAFGRGMGGAGCSCGSLVGAEMAIGYFFGRTEGTGHTPAQCLKASKAMHEHFIALNKVTCCRILCKGLKAGSPEQRAQCAKRSADSARMAAEVIIETRDKPQEKPLAGMLKL